MVGVLFPLPRAEAETEKRKWITSWPNWKQNTGAVLRKEERRPQPRKERQKERRRLKNQVSFCMETWIWDNLGCFLGSCFGLCALTGCNWEACHGIYPEQGRQGTAVLMFPTLGVLYSLDPCVLFTQFFCNKPPAIFKGLCTSAQQVFFRYSSSFIKIVWKIADLINEKVLFGFFFQSFASPVLCMFSNTLVQNKPIVLILLISVK